MKDVWLFVKWQLSKMEFWQKVFFVNMFVMGFTALRTDETSKMIFMITIFVPFAYMVKWFVLEPMFASWRKFKDDKANLFNTIKDGQ